MSKFKRLYAYIDIGCMDKISQSIQLRIIKLFAAENNSKIVFLTNEDINSIKTQIVFQSKLKESPKVDGFIFFSIDQLCYDNFNISLLNKIFKKKYDLYFAKEEFIIKYKEKFLKKKINELKIYSYIKNKKN
tara:strand:- start:2175 stop:2570 length:396 start_codon:yes stop_codon:yes gene_type:complete